MNGLIDAVLGRTRPVLLLLALVLIAGSFAYATIPKESDPDIAIPIIYVSIHHEGISAEDAERLLVRPMEKELRSIEGVKELRATAIEGSASIIIEFEAGFDSDEALNDVREKVDIAKTELPDESDEPTVNEVNIALFPVLVVTLYGPVPERLLVATARDLRDKLEALPGILEVDIAGDREDLVEVLVDPVRAEGFNQSQESLIGFIARNNELVAAGALDTGQGRFSVKVPGLFESVEDILNLPVMVKGDTTVAFRDVATAHRTFKDPTGFARVDGQPAVALEVSKRIGTNIIETLAEVRALVAEEQIGWPPGIRVGFSQDKSVDIRDMLYDLQNNVITAVLLVMVVIVAILGLRTAGLVGMAIPGSFLAGILVLSLAGLTVNIVVLFSLIMAVGMLVDGAIVVVELADRKMAEGMSRHDAYATASKRMAWPIIAATATTLAAFMPLLFWPGIVGEFMKYLPITLIATLSASLFMALIFVPTLGTLFGRRAPVSTHHTEMLVAAEHGDLAAIDGPTGRYLALLRLALRQPGKVVMLAVALLAVVYALFGEFGRGVEFFPNVEPENAVLHVRARGDLSVVERDRLVREVETRILDMREFATIYTRSGTQFRAEVGEDVIGLIQLEFIDWQRRRPAREILAEVRERTADLAGILIEVRKEESGPPVGKPIQLQFSSRFPELLSDAVMQMRAGLDSIGGFVDVTDSRPIPGIEWQLKVDRAQASRFGADIAAVGSVVKLVTNGIRLGDYRPNDTEDEVEIRVRYPFDERSIEQLDRLRIPTDKGAVPISNFVTRSAKQRVGTLNRSDGRRVLTVEADVPDGVLPDDKVREIRDWLETAGLDPRIDVAFKGEDEEQRAAEQFLVKAFAVALFVMAFILVMQFNSFYQALLILSAVVFSTVGVLLGLLVTDQPFGIVMCGIGVIALAGIVVNNNIVLIDTFNTQLGRGMEVREAVLRTGALRLRPVLLTTITTILGLLPMVLGVNVDLIGREITVGGPSTQWWTQLATAIAGGLAFATLLTLVLTPCLLLLGHRGRREASTQSTASTVTLADQTTPRGAAGL
ncbi:MAG: MMPL family transporter [Gammaproteobacteria bacterium]|jgi:multidrug efflux pump|nr:MMPL family transporter [Gammaproteobacteria bacterium]